MTYGRSREGRRAFERFPDVVADNHWIRDHSRPEQRLVVEEGDVRGGCAESLRALLTRKVRVFGSMAALDRTSAEGRERARGRQREWVRIVREDPRLVLALPVYLTVAVIPRIVAGWRKRRGSESMWHRDDSARAGPVTMAG